jgi:hypothetical protein
VDPESPRSVTRRCEFVLLLILGLDVRLGIFGAGGGGQLESRFGLDSALIVILDGEPDLITAVLNVFGMTLTADLPNFFASFAALSTVPSIAFLGHMMEDLVKYRAGFAF